MIARLLPTALGVRLACWCAALALAICGGAPVAAQNCATPANLATNGSFDSPIASGYSVTTGSGWRNNPVNLAPYGTFYNTRAAVQNPSAAPTGSAATNYPAVSLGAFAINEDDAAADTLTLTNPTGNFVRYNDTQQNIWFDFAWRKAGGATVRSSSLSVVVNGTTYLTIATVPGAASSSATLTVANGASLGANTPLVSLNAGGLGSLSQWNTVNLIVPYSGPALPVISFRMSGQGLASDDFSLDRIFAPTCPVSTLTVVKTSSVISDPTNLTTNPKAIPGARVRYCIRVTNSGTNPTAAAVTVTDPIGALPITFINGTIFVNGTVSNGTCDWNGTAGGSFSANTVSGTLGSLAAGATATLYFDAVIN